MNLIIKDKFLRLRSAVINWSANYSCEIDGMNISITPENINEWIEDWYSYTPYYRNILLLACNKAWDWIPKQ